MSKEIKILISSCLLGDNVKYSGGNNLTLDLVKLLEKYNTKLIKVCPEVFAGLPIPRIPAEIKNDEVFNKMNHNLTKEFLDGAEKTTKIALKNVVDFAILKERSPSCGSSYIYDGTFSKNLISGSGFTTRKLLENGIKVFSEENLDEIEEFLKNFI